MSFPRDFNGPGPFSNYRRTRSRSPHRFSGLAPSRAASGDYKRDRDRDRDRDRHYERDPRDRDRDRDRDRRNDRDRDLDMARTAHTAQDHPPKMDEARASAELADALRQVTDLMSRKTQLSLKRDAELKAFHKRKKDYDSQISKPVQFPAVHDAFQGSQSHHWQTLAAIEKELAALKSDETAAFDKYAQTMVKALPFDKIKIRQILEDSKPDPAPVNTPAQPAKDERLEKLEQRQGGFEEAWKQIASLREVQEKQASELAEYREKDRLRADSAKENEQLRAQVTALRSEVTSLTQRVGLVEPAQSLRAYVEKQIGELEVEFNKTVEELRRESTTKPSAAQDGSLLQEMTALGQKCGELSRDIENLKDASVSHTERTATLDTVLSKHVERIAGLETGAQKHAERIVGLDTEVQKHAEQIAGLDTGVQKHEALLSGIDVEGLDDSIADYTTLKSQAAAQDMVIAGLKQSVDQFLARVPENIPGDLPASFKAWSDRFLQVFGTKLDEHTKQIRGLQDSKSNTSAVAVAQTSRSGTASTPGMNTSLAPELEAGASGVAFAESRLTEVESKTVAIDSKVTALKETMDEVRKDVAGSQDRVNALGTQADQRYGALETMVETLTSQWNNMSTAQMAHVILEQLSRLQPAQLVPEIRHFQERLSEVEKFIHENGERHKHMRVGIQTVCDDINKGSNKRGLGSEDKFPGHNEKRARFEGQNGVNGYVHP